MATSAPAPSISVVIVCDYAAGAEGGWIAIRKSLAALAAQDISEPVEFILCESEEFRDQLPAGLTQILPGLRILFAHGNSSYDLKNVAVEAASSEFIALLDADCVPGRDWLRRMLDALRQHPQASVISGKTTYSDGSLSVRMNALLSRAYLDPGGSGPTRFIADNNCGFRRSAYLSHPIPTDKGRFANRVQSEELLRSGHVLWFEPGIGVEHDFEGWPMERDIRGNRGHATVKTRMLDGSLPYAWLIRFGPIAIAPIIGWKIFSSWKDCIRCGRDYGIRWYELPVALAGSVGVNLLEVPGMLAAFRGQEFGTTCFR